MAKLIEFEPQPWGRKFYFWCPGCKTGHTFDVRTDGGRPSWTFDGNMERPTFSPSLLYPGRVCHLYLTAGQLQFLPDCTHNLAGQTVALPDVEY